MITLKKYANGRLYDTANKTYVTKAQLADMIKEKEKVRVILAKTGKDVTREVRSTLPGLKKADANGKNKLQSKKDAIQKGFKDRRKWVAMQVGKGMDAVLEMMNFPNKRQVVRLNADMRKLAEKVDNLQKKQAHAYAEMKREHRKEMEILAQQYADRARPVETAPAPQEA